MGNILGMIRHGAKLGYNGPLLHQGRPAVSVPNHPLDDLGHAHVAATIADRLRSGRAQRVPSPAEFQLVVSPIGTVPKANGKRRTINDLSWPRRRPRVPSVNGGIAKEQVSFRYDSLDHLFGRIRAAEHPTDIWKADLTDAFFHVCVASRDARLLGYCYESTCYADCTLNFGGRSSPFLFNLFAEALHWILASFGLDVTHYLDDSFGACPAGTGAAILTFFKEVCSALGIAVSEAKSGTAEELEVLGIMVNSRTGKAWLSRDKLDKLRRQLDDILATPWARPHDLQALAGYLNFVSRVLPTGRAFLRRIYDAANASELDGSSRSTTGALGDELRWWRSIMDRWDGMTILPVNRPRTEIWSDAATTRGLGAHLGPRERCTAALSLEVPLQHQGKDILFLETLAVLEALRRWGPSLEGNEVMCKIDNAALVASLRSGRCHQRATMALIREIMGLALELHLTITPDWIPSAENDVADALSRFDWPYLNARRPHVTSLLPQPSIPQIPPPLRPSPPRAAALPPPTIPYDLACYNPQPGDA